MPTLPTFHSLMNPLIQALRLLGGSGSVDEIYEKAVEIENISEDVIAKLHDAEKSNRTEVAYRLAWARTYLKKFGLLENSSRGVWTLTPKARRDQRGRSQRGSSYCSSFRQREGTTETGEAQDG